VESRFWAAPQRANENFGKTYALDVGDFDADGQVEIITTNSYQMLLVDDG